MIPQTKLLCEMCHDAVQCIVSGLYDDAAEVLTKALSDIQQEIVAASSTEESPNGSSSPLLVPRYYQVDMDDEPSSSQIHVFDATRNMEQHKIFAAPLIVPVSNDTRYQPCSNEQYQFIITYNLALSYHLAAMTQRNLQKLEVALGLWDLIYRFHWNEDLGLVTFHTCAILNNHGHGLQQVGAEKPARDCFESLLCALCLCVEKKTHMSPVSELDSCCWNECFFHSVSTLVLKDPMTARAA